MSGDSTEEPSSSAPKPVRTFENATVRFAGDSGDGMQMSGGLFTSTAALIGNDLATFPDYPAEIRAPAGTLPGVSAFQINFSSSDIFTPGDNVNTLVAMNPAALKVNIKDVSRGGAIILNSDSFTEANLALAHYKSNPLEDGSLSAYRVHSIPITSLTRRAVASLELKPNEADRSRNLLALGFVYWLYDRPLGPTVKWIEEKFGKKEKVKQANEMALRAGYNFGITTQLFQEQYHVNKAHLKPGLYRKICGNEAAAFGLIAASHIAKKQLLYASYPITPASGILHEMVKHKNFAVKTFQAEDEIAAMSAVIGASFGGALAATATSGPGLALKGESMGLAVMLELPCVIINVQRGGPSTGLPTKSEQADLFQALWGRNGECPIPVIAAKSPSDCFKSCYEAFQIAVRYMTPVIVLSDGYLANSSAPWKIPKVEDLEAFEINHPTEKEGFHPYSRGKELARPWVLPGTPGMAHRIGGLEKEDGSGAVCYEPLNHQKMCDLRAAKIAGIADRLPEQKLFGPPSGDLLVLSWGGTFGAVHEAVVRARKKGHAVSHAHLRYINPMSRNLGEMLKGFKKFLVAELNMGQMKTILRAKFLIDAVGLNKTQGKPFTITEVQEGIENCLAKD